MNSDKGTGPERDGEMTETQNDTQESSLTALLRTHEISEPSLEIEDEHKRIVTDNFLELDQNEITLLFRIMELNPKGKIADLIDRVYRYEIRKVLGPNAAPWDENSDSYIDPLPLSVHMPRRDMLISTFMREKENPDNTGRGASSPLPRANLKRDNSGDRERTNQTTQKPIQYLDTPEISRVPPARATRERLIITEEWENNSVAHNTYTLPRRDTNENITRTVPPSNDETYYQSKYAPTDDQSIISRDSYPFNDNHVEIVSDKIHKAGNQLMRRGVKFSGRSDEDPDEYLRSLADPPLAQQIDMIYEGLQPRYIMQIDIESIRTYSDLLNQIRKYEAKVRVASRNTRPPIADRNIVSTGYDRRYRSRVNEREILTVTDELEALGINNPGDEKEMVNVQQLAITYPEVDRRNYTGTLICYNCNKPGHLPLTEKKKQIPECPSYLDNPDNFAGGLTENGGLEEYERMAMPKFAELIQSSPKENRSKVFGGVQMGQVNDWGAPNVEVMIWTWSWSNP
ncbi:hypothetical protein PV328_007718 [Microctonus aethiopoides]|uniref:Uncharacterized protein n=1 Tax=Microctonus aethiopoides TaxID=144406 RepID=A0AA39F0R8_9HYME|nr:hypothetical protein PV328_007718 [Microctonus aethiopoides]